MQTQPTATPYGYCECGCGGLAPLARSTNRAQGHIKGQPQRFILGHSAYRRDPQWEERDCGYKTPCWIWLWSMHRDGYGQAVASDGKHSRAHRVVYERLCGPVPAGLELDHLCRNPPCVNPGHLEPVTHAENMRRGTRAKLTIEQVREIRASDEPTAELAARYGVARRTISALLKGDTWRDT